MAAGAAPSPATQAALAQTVAPGQPSPAPAAAPTPTAGPPPANDAQAQIDAANAATLAQLAGSNTAGVNAGNAAQQAGQADKAAALHSILTSAIMTGGPQGPGPGGGPPAGTPTQAAALQGIVGGAYDQRIGTTGDLTAAFNAANQTREAGAANYFKEATAALPIVQEYARNQAAARALQQQLAMARLQESLATAQARGGRGGDLAGLTATEKANEVTSRVQQALEGTGAGTAGTPLSPAYIDSVIAQVATDMGITPVEAQAMYQQGLTNQGTAAARTTAQGQLSTERALSIQNLSRRLNIPVSDAQRLDQLEGASDYIDLMTNVLRDLPSVGRNEMERRVLASHPGMPERDAFLIVRDAIGRLSPADAKKAQG